MPGHHYQRLRIFFNVSIVAVVLMSLSKEYEVTHGRICLAL